jgi:hypothetical protein
MSTYKKRKIKKLEDLFLTIGRQKRKLMRKIRSPQSVANRPKHKLVLCVFPFFLMIRLNLFIKKDGSD